MSEGGWSFWWEHLKFGWLGGGDSGWVHVGVLVTVLKFVTLILDEIFLLGKKVNYRFKGTLTETRDVMHLYSDNFINYGQ